MYLKRTFIFLTLVLLVRQPAVAQSNAIGTNTPDASAQLEIAAPSKGLLPPRIALQSITDITTIVSPAAGLLVYNTATAGAAPNNVIPGYYFYTGNNWLRISGPGNARGDMQYWNGKQWVLLPAGFTFQELSNCNGIPTWGACPGNNGLALVRTDSIWNIGKITATVSSAILSSGGTAVRSRGVCFGTTANPRVTNDRTIFTGNGSGNFVTQINPEHLLYPGTTYHLRSFAINSADTAYSADAVFTTGTVNSAITETIQPFGVGSTSAWSGGIVTSDGGLPLITRKINYCTCSNMDLSAPFILDPQNVLGSFYAPITGLQPNTTYYVKASASNGYSNTRFGTQYSFTTLPAGQFAAIYFMDAVDPSSGLTDPGPVPLQTGITFSAVKAIAAGSPSFHSTIDSAFSLSGWTTGAVNGSDVFPFVPDSTSRYFEFSILPETGRTFNLTAIKFQWQRSGNGVRQAFVRSSADGFAGNLPAVISPANSNLSVVATNKFQIRDSATAAQDGCTINLSGTAFTNISSPITFRIYGINAEDSSGTFSIDNLVVNGLVN